MLAGVDVVVVVVVVDVVVADVVDVVGVTIVIQAEVNRNSETNAIKTKSRERLSNFLHIGYLLNSSIPIICLNFSRNPHKTNESQKL